MTNNEKALQLRLSSLLGGVYFRVGLIFEGAYFRRNTVRKSRLKSIFKKFKCVPYF